MRARMFGALLSVAVLCPAVARAQVYRVATPPPPATSEYAEWQFNNEPMLFAGLVYYPTRETRFFDGNIMSQVGTYRSIPIYADVTMQPYSVVYVPIGRTLLRAYEVNAARDV